MGTLIAAALFFGQVTTEVVESKEARAVALIEQLRQGDPAAQAEAERTLIAMGSEALKLLPQIGPETPESLRIRLLRIRDALASGPVQQRRPSKNYSLTGTMTPAEALQKLRTQAGLRPTPESDEYAAELPSGAIPFDVQDRPFWEVADVLLSKANLALSPYSGDSRIFALVPDPRNGGPTAGHVSVDGPFRFEAARLEAVRDLRNPEDQILRLVVMVFWEPGATPVTLQHNYSAAKIVSGEAPLVFVPNMAAVELPVRESLASVDLEFPFELPARNVQRIDRLTGTITAVIPGAKHRFKFSDLAQARAEEKSSAGVTVVLERARTADNLQSVRITIKLAGVSEEMRTHLNWVYNNVAYLKSASGERFDEILMEVYQQEEGQLGVLYKYEAPGDIGQYTFVYETPSGFTAVNAEYDLKNIELP